MYDAPSRDWVDFITLGVALIALAQPWVISLYKKIRNKPVLECFINKGASLSFSKIGVGLNCTVTMISKGSDNVITDVEVSIFKGNAKDSKIYQMNWELLSFIYNRNSYSDWISSSETTSFAPCPMYLTKGNPVSYVIYFGDEKVSKSFQETIQSGKGNDYIRDTLLTQFNFQTGDYTIDITFVDIKGNRKVFTYTFKLTDTDIDRLKYNATTICENLTLVEQKKMNIANIEIIKEGQA